MNRLHTNVAVALSLITLLFTTPFLHAQTAEKLERDLNKIIFFDAEIDFQKIPGMVIGIVHNDTTYTFSFGSLSKAATITPEANSIFEIGGITKVFTASLVEILVDEGLMDYNTSLNTYLPPSIRNAKSDISLYEAITHTAGMPRLPHGIGKRELEANNPYAFYAKRDLFEFYKNYYPVEEEENKYQYSHVTYALIETAIENITGQRFEDVLRERLLAPLQLNDTDIRLSDNQKERLSPGYNIMGNPTKPWRFSSFRGSVGMKSSVQDILSFIQVQMGESNHRYASLFEDMHQPLYETEVAKNNYIGKSWHVIKKKNHNVVLHAGSTSGHQAFVGFVKETNTGVVILSNSEHSTNSVGYLILKYLNNNWKKPKVKS